ncbi:hypothetical protein V8G58_11790, partial [Gaetbulibacter aestuarii]
MKKIPSFPSLPILVLLFFAILDNHAQVGIGTDLPNNSAQLDVVATNKGILIPRIALQTTSISNPITNPAVSLLVYNTATTADLNPGFYYWNGTEWVPIGNGSTDDLIETLTTLVDNGNGTMTYTDENGVRNIINTTVKVEDGTIDIDGDGTNDYNITLQDVINNLTTIVSGMETLTMLVDNGNGTMTYTDENGVENIINTTVKIDDGTIDIDGDGTNDNNVTLQDVINNLSTIVSSLETLTTLVDNGNGTMTYTDENGVENIINTTVKI